ncbi:ROK family transcriptional regulator [Marinomonas sp. IMCC 4694]|uniref:ROK family transcriptional regulator n=1 Tax=Marinomonas sp. IMCC 4694 TaxID=2605432 RepID=UPI0011E80209|nr:ROK family transcriptional regulator [Marinomonas sp. IMCC 4694]TYL47532.1 ROK family transcriptional regulator [Marinomonas sp. IMCC 4694]
MKSSGSTSEQSRIYNERIILHLVRQNPEISRVNIAKRTGLSAQTISVITSSLLERHLLEVTGKVIGRRGQPSIKLSINTQGAYGVGINVDRDHISAALLDFSGACVFQLERAVSFPTENLAKSIAAELITDVKATLGDRWHKVQGIGLTRPDYMDSWLETLVTDSQQRADLNALKDALAYWRSTAFETWLAQFTGVPCFCENDAVAAASSELLLASAVPYRDFFYLFVSTACGGSLVANGECYFGANGKAGSFGLIPTATGKHGKWILEALSLSSLQRFFASHGMIWSLDETTWCDIQYPLLIGRWASEVALEVAPALASVIALYDPEVVLIGGRLPQSVLIALIGCLGNALAPYTILPLPEIRMAQTGQAAGVLGAAVLPLYGTFAPQQNVLLLSSKDSKRQVSA